MSATWDLKRACLTKLMMMMMMMVMTIMTIMTMMLLIVLLLVFIDRPPPKSARLSLRSTTHVLVQQQKACARL